MRCFLQKEPYDDGECDTQHVDSLAALGETPERGLWARCEGSKRVEQSLHVAFELTHPARRELCVAN